MIQKRRIQPLLLLYLFITIAAATTSAKSTNNHVLAFTTHNPPPSVHGITIPMPIMSAAEGYHASSSFVTTSSKMTRACTKKSAAYYPSSRSTSLPLKSHRHKITKLFLSSSSHADEKKKKSKGVYARPSAAIERGSGFFVPGLEGSRVRVLFGILVLILAVVNHSIVGEETIATSSAQNISDAVAAFYGVLLLLQAFSEIGRERGFGVDLSQDGESGGDGAASMDVSDETAVVAPAGGLMQSASSSLENIFSNENGIDTVRWVAASYVALTPATHVLLLGDDDDDDVIYYSLGNFDNGSSQSKKEGAKAAINEVFQSKSGRISIPSDHPASMSLLPEGGRRCVLLQRIESENQKRFCIMVGSNQLLPAFTKNDLRWLGRLAAYVGLRLK